MIKISFIVPTYNRLELLSKTVDSILDDIKLSDRNLIEIIIVDDKSTDGTLDFIFKKYHKLILNKNMVIIEFDVNQGVTAAKNAGGRAAAGDWLVFLDSDDLLVSGGLQIIYQEIIDREGVDAIFFSCIDFSENIVGTKFTSQKLSLKSYETSGMYGEKLPVIKRNIFLMNQYDNDLRGFEGLTYFRMLTGGYILWVSNSVVRRYRTDTGVRLSSKKSILNRADKMALGYNRLISEYSKIDSRAPFMLTLKARIYSLLAYLYGLK